MAIKEKKTINDIEVEFRLIGYGTPEYKKEVQLRYEVLRKPLGLEFSEKELKEESTNEYHLCAFVKDELVGCLLLKSTGFSSAKMRQMAIAPKWQNKGIGTALVKFAEKFAREEKRVSEIVLHARERAVKFYLKQGYKTVGDDFIEVTIPHFIMRKLIR